MPTAPIGLPAWKKAPFLRLVIPFITGIFCQWHFKLPPITGWIVVIVSTLFLFIFSLASLSFQYRFKHWNGICLHTLLLATGMLLLQYKSIHQQAGWINRNYSKGSTILATLDEPLSDKRKSYKAIASARIIKTVNGGINGLQGKILLYFSKSDSLPFLQPGDQLVFCNPLQEIKNSGNPGNFNYQRYCAFREISHQVFLMPDDYEVLKVKNETLLKKFLFTSQHTLVDILSKYINGRKETGLAEAMLIGYKDNLDKDLVQAYSNTGVIHLIAISGLHLGLIYALLLFICKPLGNKRSARWLRPVIILSGLWLFSLAAGGSPSVIRSAVMFSCLVMGQCLARTSSIYNSLAASAFLLLCYNPYWLWHVGFQLSYAAVLSIVLFMKPLYHLLYFQNKLFDITWKLSAVTLSAQVLTFPLVIFHFHQFPNFFILTNLVAVPVAGIILVGCILLCLLSFIPPVASIIGYLVSKIIFALNSFIEWADRLPGATSGNLQLTAEQTICLYAGIAGFTAWLLFKKQAGAFAAFIMLATFMVLRSYSFLQASKQEKLIVYNVPQCQAIDFIAGREVVFKGDSVLLQDNFLQNFHLKPSRILHRINRKDSIPGLLSTGNFYLFGNTSIYIVDNNFKLPHNYSPIPVDILILSKNADIRIKQLLNAFLCRQLVIDSSHPAWKVNRWIKDCAQLGINCHATSVDGAFVLTLH